MEKLIEIKLFKCINGCDILQCFMGEHRIKNDLRTFRQCFGLVSIKLLKLKAKASVIQTSYEMDYHLAFTLFDFGFAYIC